MRRNFEIRNRLLGGRVYYGWFVVVACFLSSMTTFGVMYSFNVFIDPIVAHFDRSTGSVSLVFSVQSLVSFGLGTVFGLFVDRYGARRLLVLAGALVVGGLFVVSQADSFLTVVLAYGLVVSPGLGVLFIVAYATVPRWFYRRRGVATAVAVSGTGIGIIVGPPVSNYFISTVGWQQAYLLIGLLSFGLILLAAVLVADSPDDVDADYAIEFPDGNPLGDAPDRRGWRDQLADVFAVIRRPGLQFILLGFLLMYIPAYVILVHVVSHLTDVGISRQVAVFAASMIGAMNIVGKYVMGYAADRIGEIDAIVACSVLVSVGAMGYVFVAGAPGVVLTTLVFGLGYGGSAVLISPIVARFFGEIDINTLTGTIAIGFAVSGSLAPYLAGVGYDVFGSYTASLLVSGILGLLAAGAFKIAYRLDGDDPTR